MAAIKTSKNIEFDVIYADGTRRHVTEGVLFEVENNKFVFHNGTDRPAVLVGAAEAAAEVIGALGLSDEEKALAIYNIHKRIFERKNAAADMEVLS